jgi:cytochrome c553
VLLRQGLLALVLLLAAAAPLTARAGDIERGRARSAACAVCHGPIGLSKMPDVPHIAGQPEVYLAAQLEAFRAGKRRHEVMNVVAKGLSDADVADLAAFYTAVVVSAAEPAKR